MLRPVSGTCAPAFGPVSADVTVQSRQGGVTTTGYGESRTGSAATFFPLVIYAIGKKIGFSRPFARLAHWSTTLRLHYDPCAGSGH